MTYTAKQIVDILFQRKERITYNSTYEPSIENALLELKAFGFNDEVIHRHRNTYQILGVGILSGQFNETSKIMIPTAQDLDDLNVEFNEESRLGFVSRTPGKTQAFIRSGEFETKLYDTYLTELEKAAEDSPGYLDPKQPYVFLSHGTIWAASDLN